MARVICVLGLLVFVAIPTQSSADQASLARAAIAASKAIALQQGGPHPSWSTKFTCTQDSLETADIQIHEYVSGKDALALPASYSWHDAERYARAFADFGDYCVPRQRLNDGFFDHYAAILDVDAMRAAFHAGDKAIESPYLRRAIADLNRCLRSDSGIGDTDKDNIRREIASLEKRGPP